MHDDNSNNSGINSQEAIRESKENQFEALRNINSNLDLFPDKLHPNKKGQGILKGNLRRFISDSKF